MDENVEHYSVLPFGILALICTRALQTVLTRPSQPSESN